MKAFLSVLVSLAVVTAGLAQNSPHLGYAFPAGGQRGQTVEITLGGQFIAAPKSVATTGGGLDVTVGEYDRPLTQRGVQLIQQKLEDAKKAEDGEPKTDPKADPKGAKRPRLGSAEQIRELAKKAGVTDEELRKLREFRDARQDPKRQPNAQIGETVKIRVRIDSSATPGIHELRLITNNGITNPVRFVVGEFRDVSLGEAAPALPFVLNGRVLPGEVTRFPFEAPAGACLVMASQARELQPYLADAVPGRFQLSMRLLDPKGREVAFADHFQFLPDPVMAFRTKMAGTYQLEVRDALYRGREDFVFRIAVGQFPFVTSRFPLGDPAPLQSMDGWNLLDPKVVRQVHVGTGDPMFRSLEPIEPKGVVKLPLTIHGHISKRGEVDSYRFIGKKGDVVVAEVTARRLGSPLDSFLELLDPKGKLVAANDDTDDRLAGLLTHQADSYLRVTLPTSGTYSVRVRDAQEKGGPDFAYRLRLSPPQPDFELRVGPSSVTARAGTTVALTVFAVRKDGFAGDIDLKLKGAPEGFLLGGGFIPSGSDRARVTLSAPDSPNPEPFHLSLEGTSGPIGPRIAVPIDDMMQAFAYRHWVPAQDWCVEIIGGPNRGLALHGPDRPVLLPLGQALQVRLSGRLGLLAARLQTVLNEGPVGVTIVSAEMDRNGAFVTLLADVNKAKVGTSGNVIVDAFVQRPVAATAKAKATTRKVSLGTFPAIPVQIVK